MPADTATRTETLTVGARNRIQLVNVWTSCPDPPVVVQELFRKVRSILNKLTPQKFNQLMKQVTDLTIDTEERLKGVIDLVFEKAIDEPNFSVAYGNMCRCLATVSSSSGQTVATETGQRCRSFRLEVAPE